jgi:hypothetical protein
MSFDLDYPLAFLIGATIGFGIDISRVVCYFKPQLEATQQ